MGKSARQIKLLRRKKGLRAEAEANGRPAPPPPVSQRTAPPPGTPACRKCRQRAREWRWCSCGGLCETCWAEAAQRWCWHGERQNAFRHARAR